MGIIQQEEQPPGGGQERPQERRDGEADRVAAAGEDGLADADLPDQHLQVRDDDDVINYDDDDADTDNNAD